MDSEDMHKLLRMLPVLLLAIVILSSCFTASPFRRDAARVRKLTKMKVS